MQAYTDHAGKCNDAEPVAVPELVWSYARRLSMMGERNPRFKHGRGRARRWRREIDTRKGLEHRAAVLTGAATFRGADGAAHTWRELVHGRIEGRAPALHDLRRLAKHHMDRVTTLGPARGWGLPQPVRSGPGSDKWTPYVVPKASEECWRQWRRARLELVRVLHLLARWWGLLIPPHRAPGENRNATESRSSTPAAPARDGTRCRDQSGGWEAVAARIAGRLPAM